MVIFNIHCVSVSLSSVYQYEREKMFPSVYLYSGQVKLKQLPFPCFSQTSAWSPFPCACCARLCQAAVLFPGAGPMAASSGCFSDWTAVHQWTNRNFWYFFFFLLWEPYFLNFKYPGACPATWLHCSLMDNMLPWKTLLCLTPKTHQGSMNPIAVLLFKGGKKKRKETKKLD